MPARCATRNCNPSFIKIALVPSDPRLYTFAEIRSVSSTRRCGWDAPLITLCGFLASPASRPRNYHTPYDAGWQGGHPMKWLLVDFVSLSPAICNRCARCPRGLIQVPSGLDASSKPLGHQIRCTIRRVDTQRYALPFFAIWTWHRVTRAIPFVDVDVAESIFAPSVFAYLLA